MNFYLVDDDINTIKQLEFIIEGEDLGYVLGYNIDPINAIEAIKSLKPKLVIVDLLMPKINGITLVNELKHLEGTNFIMLSQVSDKGMVSDAFDQGIEFFISKPIVKKEVVKVIKNIESALLLKDVLKTVGKKTSKIMNSKQERINKIKRILNSLGISSEKGFNDIIEIINHILINNLENTNFSLKDIIKKMNKNYNTVTQRIRRSTMKGLENLAYEAKEDFYTSHVDEYCNSLFEFSELMQTIKYIKGEANKSGSVNTYHFIKGLIIQSSK